MSRVLDRRLRTFVAATASSPSSAARTFALASAPTVVTRSHLRGLAAAAAAHQSLRSQQLQLRAQLAWHSRALSSFQKPGPAPPRLPEEDQAEFERLQKLSTGAFSTPREDSANSQKSPSSSRGARETLRDAIASATSSSSSSTTTPPPAGSPPVVNQSPQVSETEQEKLDARIETGEGEELHPDVRRGAAPEFEGDVNPKTGEVGGPKNEPLRWGHSGDWSYNGRVTDF